MSSTTITTIADLFAWHVVRKNDYIPDPWRIIYYFEEANLYPCPFCRHRTHAAYWLCDSVDDIDLWECRRCFAVESRVTVRKCES